MTQNNNLDKLIAGCRKNKEASQLKLYRLYFSYGMGICLRYAQNRDSALEMLNDGFLKVFQKIDQFDSTKAFKPWFRKIIVNAAIDYYRKYDQGKNIELLLTQEHPAVRNEALDKLEFDDLMEIMQALPPAYRMVFNLYVVEGLPHAEIADQLNISVGTSKSNLSKARVKIKELLTSSQGIHFKSKKYG